MTTRPPSNQSGTSRCRTRKHLRLPGFAYGPAYVYFVTIRAARGLRPFAHRELAQAVIAHLEAVNSQRRARVYCYCLMPDHLHVVLSCVREGDSLSAVMRDFKAKTTYAAKCLGAPIPIWQGRFYDHVARSDEDLVAECQYVLENPVRAGLVSARDKWPHSGMLSPLPP